MSDFIDRLKTEAEELKSKIAKLEAFQPGLAGIDAEMETLMRAQLAAMQSYAHILSARLAKLV